MFSFLNRGHSSAGTAFALFAALLAADCGQAGNDLNINSAAALALLTAPACPGTCYDFNDSTGITTGSGLTLANGVITGTGAFTLTDATPYTETRYQVTFTVSSGGTFKLNYGNPALGGSTSLFDSQNESNTFFVRQGANSQAIDAAGTIDTLPSALTPAASSSLTYCFETHNDGASSPLHMMAWSSCLLTGANTSAYNSEDTSKIVGGITNISNAGTSPVSGSRVGFNLSNAAIDRVVIMKKP